MNFTFGIITNGENDVFLNEIIKSIHHQKIPNYEILIIGNSEVDGEMVKVIPFDETIKSTWITKKKNIITSESKYDNIVFLHDYVKFLDGWYEGQMDCGNEFFVRMDIVVDNDGQRFRDWCIWPGNGNEMDSIIGLDCLIPYDISNLSKYMYISGTYWVAKKHVMIEFKLNEDLIWCQGEDLEWSERIKNKYKISFNKNSSVRLLKQKDVIFKSFSNNTLEFIKKNYI